MKREKVFQMVEILHYRSIIVEINYLNYLLILSHDEQSELFSFSSL